MADAATEGPWRVPVANVFRVVQPLDHDHSPDPERPWLRQPWLNVAECEQASDAAFIAAARTLVPELCDEVERLRVRVAELEEWIRCVEGVTS